MRDNLVKAINSIVDEYVGYEVIYEEPLQIVNLNDNKISIRIDVMHNGKPKKLKLPKEPRYFMNEDELNVYKNIIPSEFRRIDFINTMLDNCDRTKNTYYNLLKKLVELDYVGYNIKQKLFFKKH